MKLLTLLTIILCFISFITDAQNLMTKSDPNMDAFVSDLMSRMTLSEKLGQLNLPSSGDIVTGQAQSSDIASKIREGKVGGLFNIKTAEKIRAVQQIAITESRLKIPLIFGMDVIHGYKTTFPIPLGLSCSWDMQLIEKTARVAAQECSGDGINWTFSPMVDISRDPRWGRMAEGSGEDPFLGSQIAQAMVRGYQGDDLSKNNTIVACAKHFALYGASEAGRDYNTTDMSRIRMYNEYLPPYKAAVDAGVGTMMSSFNEIDGIPATGNRWLMTELLREQWGFNGFVVTDYTAIAEMIDHGMGDLKQVSAMALKAGIDMDMVSDGFLNTLEQSVLDGKVLMTEIDNACRRILEMKYRLGLFDDPFRYCDAERVKNEVFTPENRQFAREVASQSFVLLKNDNQTLPLKRDAKIALVGPLVSNNENMPGTWSVATDFEKSVSVLDGFREYLGSHANLSVSKGCNLVADQELDKRVSVFGKPTNWDSRPPKVMIAEAVALAKKADVVVAALGESAEMSGESSSRTDIGLPETQRELLTALLATGKPVVLILFTGRPLTLVWENANIPAILNVWFPGTEAGHAIADVLYGKVNPSGKLTATFPQNLGQVPIYYNHKNTGRPLPEGQWFQKFRSNYLDVSNEPLYPFGYGLSYTIFSYGNMKVSKHQIYGNDTLTASIQLSNTGEADGAETVQLYIRDLVGSVTRPVKELKGFKKVFLKAGETKTISFDITPSDLMFYNNDLVYDWEPGEFVIMIGGNSRDVTSEKIIWSK